MKTYKFSYWLPMAALLSTVMLPVVSYGGQSNASSVTEENEGTPLGQRIGAPQVLEIAPQVEEPSPTAKRSPVETPPVAPARTVERTEPPAVEYPARTPERFPQQDENAR